MTDYPKKFDTADIIEYLLDNASRGSLEFCPKCGQPDPVIIKGGKSRSGKQMYRCTHCNKRFTENTGNIMHHSHQSYENWRVVIEDTLSGVSLMETKRKLSINIATVYRMRHRFLASIEKKG